MRLPLSALQIAILCSLRLASAMPVDEDPDFHVDADLDITQLNITLAEGGDRSLVSNFLCHRRYNWTPQCRCKYSFPNFYCDYGYGNVAASSAAPIAHPPASQSLFFMMLLAAAAIANA